MKDRIKPACSAKQRLKELHKSLRAEYAEAGLTEAQIDRLFSSDWKMYRDEREYRRHVVSVPDVRVSREKIPEFDEEYSSDYGIFVEEIENDALLGALSGLSEKDRELVFAVDVAGEPVSEFAARNGLGVEDAELRHFAAIEFLKERMDLESAKEADDEDNV